jgi:hypothetical protein
MLKDLGRGLQPFSYWARHLNIIKRGNTYFAFYDLEAVAI